MLVSTDPKLDRILGHLAQRRGLDGLAPLLLQGRMGIGKREYLHHFTRQLCCQQAYRPFGGPEGECSCPSCRRLGNGDCVDYVELTGSDPIAALRDRIANAVGHQPTMLPKRVLLLRRIDRCSGAALDTLLRLAESPPEHVRLLATARSTAALPETVTGRFQALQMAAMAPETVRAVCATRPELQALLDRAGDYPFISVGQVQVCATFGFETRFREDVLGPDFAGMERRVLAFLRAIEHDQESDFADVIEFFAEWLYWRLTRHAEQKADKQPGYRTVLAHLPGLTRMYQTTLARYLRTPNPHVAITPAAHVYGYVSALAMLRRSAVPGG